MSTVHSVALIAVMAAVTMALRFLPFLIFPEGKKLPRFLEYLGTVAYMLLVQLVFV